MYASLRRKLIGEYLMCEEQSKKDKKTPEKKESDEQHGGLAAHTEGVDFGKADSQK